MPFLINRLNEGYEFRDEGLYGLLRPVAASQHFHYQATRHRSALRGPASRRVGAASRP
jgi:hypothetical protein